MFACLFENRYIIMHIMAEMIYISMKKCKMNIEIPFFDYIMVLDPFYEYCLTLIPAWIENHLSITTARCKLQVWEWMNNFIPHFIRGVITYPSED